MKNRLRPPRFLRMCVRSLPVFFASALAAAENSPPILLDPFEVTGSLLKRAEHEAASPVLVVTRQELELSARPILSEFMAELPIAGFSSINEGVTNDGPVRGQSALNLRGFGVGNTLVLLDGRRLVTGGASWGGVPFIDLNRLPYAFIERVDVLQDSGTLYGSGGTTGVMNIILRKEFSGTEVNTRYANSLRTDVAEKEFSMVTGKSTPQSHLMAGFSYLRRAGLRAADTTFANSEDFTARYLAKGGAYAARAAQGGFDLRPITGPVARIAVATGQRNGVNGVNVAGLLPNALVTRLPGTGGSSIGALTSASVNFTTPANTGTGGTFNAAAAATYVPPNFAAGSTNSNRFDRAAYRWLVPEAERTGFNVAYRRLLAPRVAAYGWVSLQRNRTHTEFEQSSITSPDYGSLPKSNYWNPFGVDLTYFYVPVDLGPQYVDTVEKSLVLLLGVRGRLGQTWTWDTGYSYGVNQNTETMQNLVSASRWRAALAKTTPDAYNLLGGAGYKNAPATLASLRTWYAWPGETQLHTWDVRAAGEAFALPTGPVRTAFVFETSAERAAERDQWEIPGDVLSSPAYGAPFTSKVGRRFAYGLAGEMQVPLVAPERHRLVRHADLTLAARYDGFGEGFNSGAEPYAGLRVQPLRRLTLRASLARTFVAPALSQMRFGTSQISISGSEDLRRPYALTGDLVDSVSGTHGSRLTGDPKLRPSQTQAVQFGFAYDLPGALFKGLTVSATYVRLDQEDGLTTPGIIFLQNNEVGGGTADLIVREPGTETYVNRTQAPIYVLSGPNGQRTAIAPGQSATVPGRILYFRQSYMNIRDQRQQAWDFAVSYLRTFPLGRLQLSSRGTYLDFLGQANNPAPMVNMAGAAVYPRTRLQNTVTWMRGRWLGSLSHTYISRYGDINRSPFVEVDPYSKYSLTLRWQAAKDAPGWLAGARLTLSVDNLFDRDPPLDAVRNGFRIGNPRGRLFSVSLSRSQ